jgi:protein-S-isoprenylcysteine O-methyltransferase Ste14
VGNNGENKGETKRQSEKGIKAFIITTTALLVIVAALFVGSYNGYDPSPSSVSATGFVLIVMVLLTAVWYRSKYPGYSNDGTED